MILAHPSINSQLCINDSNITEWIIESPELFTKYLCELCSQVNGSEGLFVLSEEDKELSISKVVEIISNPLTIDINDKKILTKIYNELQSLANDETMYLRTREIVSALQEYFYELEHNYETTLVIDEDIELPALFRVLGVKTESDSLDFFEKLIQYIKIQNVILNKKLIVLVNIRSFLTNEQLEQLFLFMCHNEIKLLLYESIQRDFTESTKKYIIDVDQCEI